MRCRADPSARSQARSHAAPRFSAPADPPWLPPALRWRIEKALGRRRDIPPPAGGRSIGSCSPAIAPAAPAGRRIPGSPRRRSGAGRGSTPGPGSPPRSRRSPSTPWAEDWEQASAPASRREAAPAWGAGRTRERAPGFRRRRAGTGPPARAEAAPQSSVPYMCRRMTRPAVSAPKSLVMVSTAGPPSFTSVSAKARIFLPFSAASQAGAWSARDRNSLM